MALTTATIGSGITFAIDETPGGAGTAFTTVTEIISGNFNNSGNVVDVTSLGSASLSQFVMGKRGATFNFAGNFLPDSHNITLGPAMLDLLRARTIFSFQVTYNDTGTASFAIGSGFFTNVTISCSGHDDVLAFSGTIRATPTATYANGVTYSLTA